MEGCTYFGPNLSRHLKVHVRSKDMEQENVQSLAEVSGKKLRGQQFTSRVRKVTQPGRRKKWCPMEGCRRVVQQMDKHLQQVHKLVKGSVEYTIM